ncbi:putative transposase like protein [Trichonephila clavipes]|uniref:Putative transposase like protein n=1 Tax=Trichonephila clavipes TaxID=2585209 RepID=A0A8X7BJ85_TRICX|nr:putative transposase like protein [Trichonephila clavipes]
MGKKGDLSPCKKAEVKALVNAKLFSSHEISQMMKVSEASVRPIKKKIESRDELSPKGKKKGGRNPIFSHQDCETPYKIMIWSVIRGKGTGRLYVVKARSIKAFLAEQNIPLLDWLGNSPATNPIENVWELMKREVAKDVITNKTQLLERIIHVWKHHPEMQETVQSCIDSMPRRIEALIAAKVGSTKY